MINEKLIDVKFSRNNNGDLIAIEVWHRMIEIKNKRKNKKN